MKNFVGNLIYCLLILFFSFLISNSYSQEIPELELKFQQGLSLINQGNLKEAENIFNALKSHKAYKAKAYLGLGLVTREKPMQLINAMNYLKIALKIDKNFSLARYELARTAGMENTYRAAMPDLEKILGKNPDYLDSYDMYINAGWYYSQENRLIKSLNRLINQYPDRQRYYYDLAETYIRENELDHATEVLSKWSQHPNFAEQFRYYYLFSKISFLDNEDKAGLSYYWKSVDLLKDSLDVKTLLRDMIYIFDDTDLDTLLNSPVEKIKSYLRKFWKERDPDILTEENERIPEHFRRLKIAREKYRRMYQSYNPQQVLLDGSEKKLPHFIHNFTDKAAPVPDIAQRYAESIRDAKLPLDKHSISISNNVRISDSFKIQSDLDDAGFAYVRHGEPDAFVWSFTESTEGTDAHTLVTKGFKTSFVNVIRNMSWLYYPKKGQARMLLHFNQYYASLGYEMALLPASFEDLWILDPRYSRLDVARIEEMKEESKIHIMHATTTEASSVIYGGEPVELSIALFNFKDKPDSNHVFFYFPNHVNPNHAFQAAHDSKLLYLYAIQLFDKPGYLRFEKNVSKFMNISGLPMKDSPVTIFNLMDFNICPGDYTLKFALKDVYQEMAGEYVGKINLIPFPKDTLILSDLIYGIRKGNPAPTYFNRNGVIIQPWNFFTIKKEIPLAIYFEIYNLNLDENGNVNYEVEYLLKSKKGKNILNFLEKKQKQVGSKYQVMGDKSDEFFTLDLKLPQNVKDQYLLIIIVKDLMTGKSAGREVQLEVE